MIGRLRGQLVAKHPPQVLIDCAGVGYEVDTPMSTFYDLPAVGEPVTLLTHLVVRDDAHVLYGFRSAQDRTLFRGLLRVSGVGAKMALAILSGMDAERFARCVEHEDVAMLSRLPGIGGKTAQRLVMEMKDRVGALEPAAAGGAGAEPGDAHGAEDPLNDAIGALVALGYKPAEAGRMARKAVGDAAGGTASSEEIIRAALKALTPP